MYLLVIIVPDHIQVINLFDDKNTFGLHRRKRIAYGSFAPQLGSKMQDEFVFEKVLRSIAFSNVLLTRGCSCVGRRRLAQAHMNLLVQLAGQVEHEIAVHGPK